MARHWYNHPPRTGLPMLSKLVWVRSLKVVAAFLAMVSVAVLGTQSASAHMIGHIWCGSDVACVLRYYDWDGYFMARRNFDMNWVRLTMVTGANNTHVAPITCVSRYACVVQYHQGFQEIGYWMARQENGTIWVRLTEVS